MRKTLVAAALCSASVVGVSAGSALAGEITGNGKPTPVNDYRAGSICAFSGLDDNDFEAPVEPGTTQPFGGELQAFAAFYPSRLSLKMWLEITTRWISEVPS